MCLNSFSDGYRSKRNVHPKERKVADNDASASFSDIIVLKKDPPRKSETGEEVTHDTDTAYYTGGVTTTATRHTKVCGARKPKKYFRIVGGTITAKHEYPWQVICMGSPFLFLIFHMFSVSH